MAVVVMPTDTARFDLYAIRKQDGQTIKRKICPPKDVYTS